VTGKMIKTSWLLEENGSKGNGTLIFLIIMK
jgi:hypothetical protein